MTDTNDAASLDALLDVPQASAAAAEPAVTPSAAPEGSQQPGEKDDETAPPAASAQQQTAGSEPKMVPVTALEKERRKRQEYERELEALRKQLQPEQQTQQQQQRQGPQPPDPFTDPAGFAEFVQAQVEERFLTHRLNDSEERAIATYGADVVDAAYEAVLKAGPHEAQRLLATKDPYAELVKWHKRQLAMAEVGDDIEAYKARLREELLAELQGGGKAPNPASNPSQTPAAKVPKTLGRTPSVQPRDESGRFASGPAPLTEILGE
jgi:hypothetical protein